VLDWPFQGSCDDLRTYAEGLFDKLRREARRSEVRALVAPIDPFNRSRVLAPLVAAAGVFSVLVLSGVAVGAIAAAATALLAIYLLLTRVFGYQIELAMPGAPS
jgi:hypothetical protein